MGNTVHSQRNVVVFNLMGVFRHSCRDVSRRGSCEVSSRGERGGGVTHGQHRALSKECGRV